LGTDVIEGCDPEGGGDIWHHFGGWADGGKVILPGKNGEINVIDVETLSLETYKYDASVLRFTLVDRLLKYWVFWKTTGGGEGYVILDNNQKIVWTGPHYISALYDKINGGFVFTTFTSASTSTESMKLDFLPIDSLTLRNIFTSDPFMPAQRDGEPPSLSSKPGEIMYSPGFGGLDMKYFGANGTIHIKL